MPKLKKYNIDCGDSTSGPVGFVACLEATSPRDALKKFNLLGFVEHTLWVGNVAVQLYITPSNVTLKDVSLET